MSNYLNKFTLILLFAVICAGFYLTNPDRTFAQRRAKTRKLPKTKLSALNLVSEKPLDGAFIQFWGNRRRSEWQKVMNAIKAVNMHTIILQYLANRVISVKDNTKVFDSTGCGVMDDPAFFIYPDAEKASTDEVDPTEYILQYAEQNNMKVYIGLFNDERFVYNEGINSQWNKPQCLKLDERESENKELAKKIWNRYHNYKSFSGWYFPFEMWNQPYTEKQIQDFRRFSGKISVACKAFDKNKKVLVSPFFNPDSPPFLFAKDFSVTYGKFLKSDSESAGIDIVMLQDSVGAKNIQIDDISNKVAPFYTELKSMCVNKGCTLWANVESFESNYTPTSIERFQKQIETANSILTNKPTEQVVTFDFFHYMNPYGTLHSDYAEKELKLYCKYLQIFFPNQPLPEGINCSDADSL